MLVHLAAKNLGLITDAELVPSQGFTVITGETGAGKTLLLGAIRLILGETADSSIVGPAGDATTVEGVFVDEAELPVSRIVPRDGRSRAYRDGIIVSAQSLRDELGGRIQVVGQHDQFELRKPKFVLGLIDQNLAADGRATRSQYTTAWADYTLLLDEQSGLGGSRSELARDLDLARYQADEIRTSGFVVGEDEALEATGTRLRHLEEITERMRLAGQNLDLLVEEAGELVSNLRKVASLDGSASGLAQGSESIAIALAELAREVSDEMGKLSLDPASAAEIDQRLTLLGQLKMKYGKTIGEILAFGEEAGRRVIELEGLLDRAGSIDADVEEAHRRLSRAGEQLSIARREVARSIATGILGHLQDVGLGGAHVEFDFESSPLTATGADHVDLLFSSSDQLRAGPISKVASGGELSRLILAVNLATGSEGKQTLVFDEVDAGVGGATALAMGEKLADLAQHQQLLCVTHLPQVAAFADRHYVITRHDSVAELSLVEGPARLEELSRMMAGIPESDRGQKAAEELLELSRK